MKKGGGNQEAKECKKQDEWFWNHCREKERSGKCLLLHDYWIAPALLLPKIGLHEARPCLSNLLLRLCNTAMLIWGSYRENGESEKIFSPSSLFVLVKKSEREEEKSESQRGGKNQLIEQWALKILFFFSLCFADCHRPHPPDILSLLACTLFLATNVSRLVTLSWFKSSWKRVR